MKPTVVALSILVLAAFLLPAAALAQYNSQSGAVVALHIQPHTTKGLSCDNLSSSLPCSDYTTEWPVQEPADVYLVVAKARADLGVSGVSCGIDYGAPGSMVDGVGCDVFGYTICCDLEYPSSPDENVAHEWPASGGGNRMIWVRTSNCQRNEIGTDGVHAVACAFYVYAYGASDFAVTRNDTQNPPEFQVVDCPGPALSDLSFPAAAGMIGFGSPGYNPCSGGGITPLYLLSASGNGGTDQVRVRFSKNVAGGASEPSNYHVYPNAYPSSDLAVTAAVPSGSDVILTLGAMLSGTSVYTVEVSNVQDEDGGTINPGSSVSFIAGGPDTTPPWLLSVSGEADHNMVTVVFSETVGGGASVPSNYTVYPASDPSSPLAVTGAARSTNVITLTLGSNLAGSTSYIVSVSNVEDMAGNPIAPNSTASFSTRPGDTLPPTLVDATGEPGHNSVAVTFSEALGTNANTASNYTVYPTADPGSPLPVISATHSQDQATLTLSSNLVASTRYTVGVSNVQDLAGNPIVANSTVQFTTGTGDITPPVLNSAVGAASSDNVTARFSEPVVGGATTFANYSVYPTSDASATFSINAVVVAASQVTLRLNGTLAGATSYTVQVSNVTDAAGNVIAPNSTAEFTTDVAGGGPGDQSRAVVALHVQAHDTKAFGCGSMSQDLPCDRFVREWPVGSPADVFMVVCMADPVFGVSGVSLGVQYANTATLADGVGVDVLGYTSCADLEYANSPDGSADHEFPYSGGGNRLIWDRTTNCPRQTVKPWGVQVVACAFYVYAYGPDQFQVDMNRNLATGPEFQIVDCPGPYLSDMQWPEHAGSVGFGQSRSGYSPCTAMVPTVHTTWGRLKNQYH
jgi:hypothetical protein